MTVDGCSGGQIPDSDTSQTTGRSSCQQTKTTPGENRFLNVDTLLELGGRSSGQNTWWPNEITSASRQAYNGCVRNLKHNGEVSWNKHPITDALHAPYSSVMTRTCHLIQAQMDLTTAWRT